MLLNMVIMLAVTSLMFEGLIAYRVESYRRLMQRREWLSIIVSMTLSYVIGKLFGAQGLICLMAGIASTVCSPFMYRSLHYCDVNRDELRAQVKRGQELTHDMFRLFVLICKILTFPFKIVRVILATADRVSDGYANLRDQATTSK